MSIEIFDNNTLLVVLPCEADSSNKSTTIADELTSVIEMLQNNATNIIIDFSNVDIICGISLSRLLGLRQIVADSGHKLVLFSVRPATKGIFTLCGNLQVLFEFADDLNDAIGVLQRVNVKVMRV